MIGEKLDRLLDGLNVIARWAVWAGGAMMLAAAFFVTADVISRKLLSAPIGNSDEVSSYFFAISTTWAYAYCVLHRANVRIDALYNLLPRPVGAILDVIALTLLGAYKGVVTNNAINTLIESWDSASTANTPLQTPLALPQFFWVVGLVFFLFVMIVLLVRALLHLVGGNFNGVGAIAGVRGVEEEMEEELHIPTSRNRGAGG